MSEHGMAHPAPLLKTFQFARTYATASGLNVSREILCSLIMAVQCSAEFNMYGRVVKYLSTTAPAQNQEVVIVSAARTPVGCFNGSLKKFSATQLGAIAARAAIDRA
ncbi:hypothetical protein BC936DRAFT_146718, partial [Jimgerdemannia flammicorona]